MSEKRDDIPNDPEERRAMAERLRNELGLAVQEPEDAGTTTTAASRKANDKAGRPTAINTPDMKAIVSGIHENPPGTQ
jgi:tellurite resistance protein